MEESIGFPKQMPMPTNLIDGLKSILPETEKSALSEPYLSRVKVPMDYLCQRLELNPVQVTILIVVMELGFQRRVNLRMVANHLGISALDLMSRGDDLEGLFSRRLVKQFRNGREISFATPIEVYKAFIHNEVYRYETPIFQDNEELAQYINGLINKLDECEYEKEKEIDVFDADIKEILAANIKLPLASTLTEIRRVTTYDEFRIALLMSIFWVIYDTVEIKSDQFSIVFCHGSEAYHMATRMKDGRTNLIKKDIVKLASFEEIMAEGVFALTPQCRQALTPDRTVNDDTQYSSRLTHCADLSSKEMFYNPEIVCEVERLQQLLQPEQTDSILSRLKEKGMRGGFTCLLYGEPGTGKTETVFQLARISGRDIFQVDISKLRSKWYGESERLVKKTFDDYRRIVRNSKIAPILFFNEADAIFTRRMENATRSVDKGENALQNIILQEMENLDGILIATTNLQGNLDSAFERRFLYKLQLGKPNAEVKAKIWQSMLPDISDEEARSLAREYDFSGGQIENIVRKCIIDELLNGKKADFQTLRDLCCHEVIDNKQPKAIGFAHRA